jgi:hypothetical protein
LKGLVRVLTSAQHAHIFKMPRPGVFTNLASTEVQISVSPDDSSAELA